MSEYADPRNWLEMTKETGMALGLQNTSKLLKLLDLKLSNTTIIHVAGSNGKGTLCALLATNFTLTEQSNVLFSSPHLCRVEERIRIGGVPVTADLFDEAVKMIQLVSITSNIIPTFFEVTFLASMIVASKTNVKFLILETGLGGRLDATRCAPADLALLTSISMEHTDILGGEINQIIKEKAAIARPGKPIIARVMNTIDYQKIVEDVAQNCYQSLIDGEKQPAQCHFIDIPDGTTARKEARILAQRALTILSQKSMLGDAEELLNWPGRLQRISLPSGHKMILEAAHNPTGLEKISPELMNLISTEYSAQKTCIIFATSPQQDMTAMLDGIATICNEIGNVELILTKPHGGRYPGVEPKILSQYPWPTTEIHHYQHVGDALEVLLQRAPEKCGTILSIGSLYLQGNILTYLGLDGDEDLSLIPKDSNVVEHSKGD
ncbi:Mur ligase family protein [Candidatus Poseidoniaceae archaeon]|nr:Mur ligase family protein [Candidatus Poseidoniaceae archaeon]